MEISNNNINTRSSSGANANAEQNTNYSRCSEPQDSLHSRMTPLEESHSANGNMNNTPTSCGMTSALEPAAAVVLANSDNCNHNTAGYCDVDRHIKASADEANSSPPTSSIVTESHAGNSSVCSSGVSSPMQPSHINQNIGPDNPNQSSLEFPRPNRESVLRRLSEALMSKSLTKINLSQRNLQPSDARLVKLALLQNSSLSVLKLGYNNLCDEGVVKLASGISSHSKLISLDVGFNSVGNLGCAALSKAISSTVRNGGALHTLYLAGNNITEEGAFNLAQVFKEGNGLRRLHLTENSIGPGGTKVLMDAIAENEVRSNEANEAGLISASTGLTSTQSISGDSIHITTRLAGVEELFLGGTGMGHAGCAAVANLLRKTKSLRVLSLANCCLDDEDAAVLAAAITENCKELPLRRLQLSFNNLTSKGIENLMNAAWGLTSLHELQLDHNRMESRGAQLVSAVLKGVKTLKRLDVGFNSISGTGMKLLMKTVAESASIESLSISGNHIDVMSAKAVSYALAHNKSLKSVFLDHCKIPSQGQRDITAGIVSNSKTSLEILTGFNIGGNAVSLGLPGTLGKWPNEQVLKFVLLMWNQMRREQKKNSHENQLDPLLLLPSGEPIAPGPLDPSTVVSVANRAFESLSPNGDEILGQNTEARCAASFVSPLTEDAVILEAAESDVPPITYEGQAHNSSTDNLRESTGMRNPSIPDSLEFSNSQDTSRVLDEATKKKMIVKWLSQNIHHLNELSQLPFNSSELWRLHQHFFTPTIQMTCRKNNDCDSTVGSDTMASFTSSCNRAPASSILSAPCGTFPIKKSSNVPVSEPVIHGTMPMLKRKVSYRYLAEASISSSTPISEPQQVDASVSTLIEHMNGQSMQPRSKRARKNQSRISIVPRIKKKLHSFLDRDHRKALGFMRQLHYVEKCLLNGRIYPVEDLGTATHLIGSLAADAEKILLDFI